MEQGSSAGQYSVAVYLDQVMQLCSPRQQQLNNEPNLSLSSVHELLISNYEEITYYGSMPPRGSFHPSNLESSASLSQLIYSLRPQQNNEPPDQLLPPLPEDVNFRSKPPSGSHPSNIELPTFLPSIKENDTTQTLLSDPFFAPHGDLVGDSTTVTMEPTNQRVETRTHHMIPGTGSSIPLGFTGIEDIGGSSSHASGFNFTSFNYVKGPNISGYKAPSENLVGDSMNVVTEPSNWGIETRMPGSSHSLGLMGIEGNGSSSSSHASGLITSYNTQVPNISGSNFNSGIPYYTKGTNISGYKRKMFWEELSAPRYRSRYSFVQDQGQSSSNLDSVSSIRFGLYDERYEALSLPMDPHLRIFNLNKGTGNGYNEGSTNIEKSR